MYFVRIQKNVFLTEEYDTSQFLWRECIFFIFMYFVNTFSLSGVGTFNSYNFGSMRPFMWVNTKMVSIFLVWLKEKWRQNLQPFSTDIPYYF